MIIPHELFVALSSVPETGSAVSILVSPVVGGAAVHDAEGTGQDVLEVFPFGHSQRDGVILAVFVVIPALDGLEVLIEAVEGVRRGGQAGMFEDLAVVEETGTHTNRIAGQDVGATIDAAVSLGHSIAGGGIGIQPVLEVRHDVRILIQVDQHAFTAVLRALRGVDGHLEEHVRQIAGSQAQVQCGRTVRRRNRNELNVHIGQFFQLLPEPDGRPVRRHHVGICMHGRDGDLLVGQRIEGLIHGRALYSKRRNTARQHHKSQQQGNERLFHRETSFFILAHPGI